MDVLVWAGWERAVDLRASDVQAIAPDGGVVAALPDIAIRLSLTELARGQIRPTEVELVRPRLRLNRAADGRIDLGLGESGDTGDSGLLLAALLDEVEHGETITISRDGTAEEQPFAPFDESRREDARRAIAELRELRKTAPRATVDEIIAWKNEGRE